MYCDPDVATDVYTRQCALLVSACDLAVMGATLANGGVNPMTGVQAIATRHCQHVLAVLATSGLYERSGDWLYDVGLPGKSGVSGGIVTVSPGKGEWARSPPLDAAGNSVRGQHMTRYLAEELGLSLFDSVPSRPPVRCARPRRVNEVRLLGHGGEAAALRGTIGTLWDEHGSRTRHVGPNPYLLDIGEG